MSKICVTGGLEHLISTISCDLRFIQFRNRFHLNKTHYPEEHNLTKMSPLKCSPSRTISSNILKL